jgi:ribosome-binding factor A
MAFRHERGEELIKQEVANIILRDLDFPVGALVTVMRVSISPEFTHARVFVSTFPDEFSDRVLEILNKNIYHIQKLLDRKLKMRPIPQLIFRNDKDTPV